MNIYVGTDIIEVERIQDSIKEHGDNFINRIFTEEEIKYCESKNEMKNQHYAARFAAKEATFKAVSSLLNNKYSISWKNIQIKNEESGKPKIFFLDLEEDVVKQLEPIKSIDVSLSHLKEYAIANVTAIV